MRPGKSKMGYSKKGSGGNFIAGMHMKKGALRAEMGVKKGQTIPAGRLAKAAKAPGKLGKRARLAQTLKKLNAGKAQF